MVVKKYKYFKNSFLKGLILSAGRGRQIQPNFINTVFLFKKTKACGIQYRSINRFFGHRVLEVICLCLFDIFGIFKEQN